MCENFFPLLEILLVHVFANNLRTNNNRTTYPMIEYHNIILNVFGGRFHIFNKAEEIKLLDKK
jgi:hypothetical protein